jgi:hypothetical protein
MPASFATDIKLLFRPGDVTCMHRFGVSLENYDYMSDASGEGTFADHANARHVYARLTGAETPRMPMDGLFWADTQLALFNQWMTDGFQP